MRRGEFVVIVLLVAGCFSVNVEAQQSATKNATKKDRTAMRASNSCEQIALSPATLTSTDTINTVAINDCVSYVKRFEKNKEELTVKKVIKIREWLINQNGLIRDELMTGIEKNAVNDEKIKLLSKINSVVPNAAIMNSCSSYDSLLQKDLSNNDGLEAAVSCLNYLEKNQTSQASPKNADDIKNKFKAKLADIEIKRKTELAAINTKLQSGHVADLVEEKQKIDLLASIAIIESVISASGQPDCDCYKKVKGHKDSDPTHLDSIKTCINDLESQVCASIHSKESILTAAKLRDSLRVRRDNRNNDITAYQQRLVTAQTLTARETIAQNISDAKTERDKIDEILGGSDYKNSLIVGFREYNRYFYTFNLGAEYATIDKAFQKGFPRVGFRIYRRYGGRDSDVLASAGTSTIVSAGTSTTGKSPRKWWWDPGLHIMGDVKLTSSAEQKQTDQNVTVQGENKTLETDLSVYAPLVRGMFLTANNLLVSDYWGVIVSAGFKKTDGDVFAARRYYAGIRTALNPDLYWDILLGRTTGLDSRRLEIRAQAPVMVFENGTRLYAGAIGNFGVDNKRTKTDPSQNEKDVVRFYLIWNVDFDGVLGALKGE